MKYQYHVDGTKPTPTMMGGNVFVFGSNLLGMHGGGAARAALELYGAKWFWGDGWVGNSYAIPTKHDFQSTMSLDEIRAYVDKFLEVASRFGGNTFFVTRIGCVIAGHSDADIAPMFKGATTNCNFPEEWSEYLE